MLPTTREKGEKSLWWARTEEREAMASRQRVSGMGEQGTGYGSRQRERQGQDRVGPNLFLLCARQRRPRPGRGCIQVWRCLYY